MRVWSEILMRAKGWGVTADGITKTDAKFLQLTVDSYVQVSD